MRVRIYLMNLILIFAYITQILVLWGIIKLITNIMIEVQTSQRQVRKKYEKVNGCTHSPSFTQILGLGLMTTIIVLQANIISAISAISNAILTTFTALSYAILLLIVYDYIRLVLVDPVDPRVVD